MATARVWRGVHREDWQDTDWVDGGTVVTINTDIKLEGTQAMNDTDVELYVTEVNGSPVLSTPVRSIVAGLLRVTFSNTAPAGNQAKWLCKIGRNHSICR